MNFNVTGLGITAAEIDRAISGLVNHPRRDDFRDIGVWLIKTGIGEKGAKERLIKELSERVSKEITGGVVQLTVLELEEEMTEIKAHIERSLPPFYPNVQFVVKSGAIDIDTLTYWFKVTAKVILENLSVRVKNKEIAGINSGSLQASVTLAFCGRNRENETPFILLEDKPLINLELAKALTFGTPSG